MTRRSFIIPLRPRPKERPRHNKWGSYTPAATREYENEVRRCYETAFPNAEPIDKPVMLTIRFDFAIPKSVTKKLRQKLLSGEYPYTGRPDLDNLEKAIMDALNKVAFKDDSLVAAKVSLKRFAATSCAVVIIDEMEVFGDEYGVLARSIGTDESARCDEAAVG